MAATEEVRVEQHRTKGFTKKSLNCCDVTASFVVAMTAASLTGYYVQRWDQGVSLQVPNEGIESRQASLKKAASLPLDEIMRSSQM